VKRIEGVEKVVNNIEVLPTSFNDDRIRRDVYRKIYGNDVLSPYQLRAVPPIHIIVKNGNVTLEGAVARQMDKQIAGVQANSVSGVFSVTNNLQVEEASDDKKKEDKKDDKKK
jgi:hyperosmotically inducible protein